MLLSHISLVLLMDIPFCSRLFLMRIIDIPYLNITGPDCEYVPRVVYKCTFLHQDLWQYSLKNILKRKAANIDDYYTILDYCYKRMQCAFW